MNILWHRVAYATVSFLVAEAVAIPVLIYILWGYHVDFTSWPLSLTAGDFAMLLVWVVILLAYFTRLAYLRRFK